MAGGRESRFSRAQAQTGRRTPQREVPKKAPTMTARAEGRKGLSDREVAK